MYLILFAARLLLAGLFAVAGAGKLLSGSDKSRKALRDFGVLKSLVAPLSIALPVAELIVAVLLLVNSSARIAAFSALALVVVFNIAIAANLILGKTPSCNCFGQLHSKPIGWITFARNSVLASFAGFVAWHFRPSPRGHLLGAIQALSPEIEAIILVFLGFTGFGLLAFLVLQLFRQNGRLLIRIEQLEAAVWSKAPQLGGARPVPHVVGLPIGAPAPAFDLPNISGGRSGLKGFLQKGKPLLLLFTDPNCGPCSALMPEVARWQQQRAATANIVVMSRGKYGLVRDKAVEYGLRDVLVDIDNSGKVADSYHAYGTPTAVIVRTDGTIGSHLVGGADAIRELVSNQSWTEPMVPSLPQPIMPRPQLVNAHSGLIPGSFAPAFKLPDLGGDILTPDSLKGQNTVLLFWNPACGFCQRMLPEIKTWEQTRSETSPYLVFVSQGPREVNREMGLNSRILLDEQFRVAQMFGANGTPSGVLIDTEGKIASKLAIGALGVFELLGASHNGNPGRQHAAVAAVNGQAVS